MEAVYILEFCCRRNGTLYVLFIAKRETVQEALGQEVYFGEVLGKHSEISGLLDDGDIRELTTDPQQVALFKQLFRVQEEGEKDPQGIDLLGYNPLRYLTAEEA
jgi:hypothetical protein